jgi:hypothetical protein
MTKHFLVAGVNWVADVDLSSFDLDSPQTEAATRAVEALYGKRQDIPIKRFKPHKAKKQNEVHKALFDLLTNEITPGCRIGMLLYIQDANNQMNEWFISSKNVLENVGYPSLVTAFDKKYPNKEKSKTT